MTEIVHCDYIQGYNDDSPTELHNTCDNVPDTAKCRHRRSQDVFKNPWMLTVSTFLAHFLTCGVSYSIGVYYVTFLDVFDETNGVTSWIGSLNTGTLCASGPLASYMIDRIGSRYTVMIGGVLASIGIAIGSLAPNIFVLFISFGLITGLGYGLVFTCAVVVIGISLEKHRTLAMGVTISGIGLGNFVYPFLATYLMDVYGWRGALLITSAITLNVCVFGMFMIGGKPSSCDETDGDDPTICDLEYDSSTKATGCDQNKLLTPVILKTAPSIDPVLMTHSVQSLHLLITNKLHENCRLEKARSSEALVSRRLLQVKNNGAKCFSSLQTLDQHKVKDIENDIISNKLAKSKSTMCNESDVQWGSLKDKNSNAYQCNNVDKQTKWNDNNDLFDLSKAESSTYFYAFKYYQYWLVQCNTVLFCLSLSVVLTHIFAYSQYQGLSQEQATILISFNGAANVVGRITLGACVGHKKINTTWLFIICYTIAGVACLVMTAWITFPGLSVCVVCFGFFSAAFGPILSEVTMEILGVEHFNFGYGFLMISMAMGITLGAPTAGWLYDITQQYTSSFYLGGASLLTSSLLMLPIVIYKKPAKATEATPGEWPEDLAIEIEYK